MHMDPVCLSITLATPPKRLTDNDKTCSTLPDDVYKEGESQSQIFPGRS
mgnify:CR=1 FL=1